MMTACGGGAVSTQSLATAEAAVRAAEVGGAPEVPKAELHLKYARDQIAKAKKLAEDGEEEQSQRALERAVVDAELALGLARHEDARAEAEEELKRIEQMMGSK
jgi:hypothetical protein